jgi:uncharacterized protein DUF3175
MPSTKKSAKKKSSSRKTSSKKSSASKKSSSKKSSSKKSSSPHRWVAKVTTDSTHPPEGLFTKNAATIARTLASKKVSPKGPGSGMRMLTYYINRAGKGLTSTHRAELEKAKSLLSKRVAAAKENRP